MKRVAVVFLSAVLTFCFAFCASGKSWIRINQLGYTPKGIKNAVWCSTEAETTKRFDVIDANTGKIAYTGKLSECFGAYASFSHTARLNFSSFTKAGKYFLRVAETDSPVFTIGADVYKGTADFCLRYMRQQRSGFNPFLKDSCHTHDGYSLYGEAAGIKDSTHIPVSGGWHDASDYLQYSTTSANATYHLLSAYRDFPNVFTDEHAANGLKGKNGTADVLDEARWGLDWLLKMHPRADLMFNQLGDDRDHMGMRIPKEDTNYYGKGLERPVYFINGEPQQRGKFLNATKGTSSTAAKFSSAFSLGALILNKIDLSYSNILQTRALSALAFSLKKLGVTQTASVRSPYIYAEENWVDDMELAYASLYTMQSFLGDHNQLDAVESQIDYLENAKKYAGAEKITPWLGADTAAHYQWYPFINLGHYELAKLLKGEKRNEVTGYYRNGIEKVWNKAKQNAFFRGIPFIWCSNNLTTSFAIQCYWYRALTNDKSYAELEQANIDWLFGCNPWGTGMVYGLPAWGDTPTDPHSAFTHLKNYPIDGGLVDGPVYTSIYKNLIGIKLYQPDEYAEFQNDLAVYHDDYGDYSTNEPTMDGTASLIYLLAAKENEAASNKLNFTYSQGAVIRSDSTKKQIALVFTGDEFGEGLPSIIQTLNKENIKGSFFFTGRFYRNAKFTASLLQLQKQKHYLGPHSDAHLLYNDWTDRNKTLVTQDSFNIDLGNNIEAMQGKGIRYTAPQFFIPPYEWWNDTIASWASQKEFRLFSLTPGTYTNADYTWPELGTQYKSNQILFDKIKSEPINSWNGKIILIHAGTDPRRKEKFYERLPELIEYFRKNGYQFKRIDELLN